MALFSSGLLAVLEHWETFASNCAKTGQAPDVLAFTNWLTTQATPAPIADTAAQRVRKADTVLMYIWRMARLFRRAFRHRFAGMALTSPEEFLLLYTVFQTPAPGLSKTILFRKVLLEVTTGGQMLARLVGQGLVTESPDAADGRVIRVTLTAAGHATFQQAALGFDAVSLALVAGLAPRELTQLVNLLGQLVARQPAQ